MTDAYVVGSATGPSHRVMEEDIIGEALSP